MYITNKTMKILFWFVLIFVFTVFILPSGTQIYYFFEGSKNLQWNHFFFAIGMFIVGCIVIRLVWKKFKLFVKYYEQHNPEGFN